MKKYLFAVVAVATMLAGCAKEIAAPEVPVEPQTPDNQILNEITLKANVGEAETRVSIDGFKAFAWQDGDIISVLDNTGAPFDFTTSGTGTSVDFTGSIAGSLGKYAMYPASDDHLAIDDDIVFNLPGTLTWTANGSNMPMLGKISAGVGTFKSVGGVLKLVVYNIPSGAESLWIKATNKQIRGNFEIDGTEDSPAIVTAAKVGSNNELTIDFSADYSANKVFYIPLPTGTIDGFSVEIYNGSLEKVFSRTTTASFTVARNQLTIGPALNCGLLWEDDFGVYSKNDVPSDLGGEGYDGSSITYSETDGGSTTKFYEENSAGGVSPELLIGSSSGTFKASGIPTGGASTMILSFKENYDRITVSSTTDGVTVSDGTFDSVNKTYKATVNNSKSASKIDLVFSNTVSNNVRFDNVSLYKATSTPTITGGNSLTIGVGFVSRSMSVGLSNPVDDLGLSYELSKKDDKSLDWVASVAISAGTLTVTSTGANGEAVDREAVLTLKASGAANKVINLKQTSALVQKPASLSVVPGNASFSANWSQAAHATGYKAYINTSSGLADPSVGGTEVTATDNGNGTFSASASGLTNGTEYYLYVKVNTVDDGYIADSRYAEQSFTPDLVLYYEKVEGVGGLESGVKYLIVNEESSKAFNGGIASASYDVTSNNISVAISEGKIVSNSTTNAASFTITGGTGAYIIKSAAGYYVGRSSGNSTGIDASTTTSCTHAITFDASKNSIITDSNSGTGMRIRYNASSGQYRFRYYSSDSGKEVQLYKLNSPLESPGLSYGTLAVSKKTTDGKFTNSLTNPYSLGITYTSSNTSVATIDSNGEVTITGAGSTTITATSAETAVYKEGVATYVLTVTAWSAVTFSNPSHGSITVKKGVTTLASGDLVPAGETITITTTPDDGYELSTLVYNDGSDHDIKAAKSFSMPGKAVSISATFTAIPTSGITPTEGTCFNLTSYGSIPSGWSSSSVSTGSYFKIDAGGYMISPAYDISSCSTATVSVKVAKFGTGTNPAAVIYVSYDRGETWTESKTLTAPSNSTYLDAQTLSLSSTFTKNVVIKIVNPAGNAALRVQNFSFTVTD